MSKAVFTLKTLHRLQRLESGFNESLTAAVDDCKRRPGLKKAREITIKVKVLPDESEPEDCVVVTTLSSKFPNRLIDPYKMQSTKNNGLKFEPSSPMNPDQNSFDFDDED